MDSQRLGRALRAVRIRRGMRQSDVAGGSRASRWVVSRIERGHLDGVPLRVLREVAQALDARIEVSLRWRGGDLDRLVNARHSALHESVARWFESRPGWFIAPEVSFAIYGERGVIDVLAFHPASGALLVVELKTDVVDVQELIGTLDRKRRLAARVARERGWQAATVSAWLVIWDTRTNRRRVGAHRAFLGAAFPYDGRAMRRWLRHPRDPVSGLSFWTIAHRAHAIPFPATQHRVRVRRKPRSPASLSTGDRPAAPGRGSRAE